MKKRLILVVSLLMVFAFTAGVMADTAVQTITANLAADFKFVVNGESWQPKDADGSDLVPIVYNGRTYLPYRVIGEVLDVAVVWDDATKTVTISKAPTPVVPTPVAPTPVEPEPVDPEPVDPEPAADLAIAPAGIDLSKANVIDIPIDVTWGAATEVTGITGSALGGAVNLTLKEGKEYSVEGDVLTIKKELAALLPVPIAAVPEGTVLTLTIKFDQGEKTFDIKVVS